jgi:hypothetical protein
VCEGDEHPADLRALYIAAALAPSSRASGNMRYTAVQEIEALARDWDDDDGMDAGGFAALLRAGLMGLLLDRVASVDLHGLDVVDEDQILGQVYCVTHNSMGRLQRFFERERQGGMEWARRNRAVAGQLQPGPLGLQAKFADHFGAGRVHTLSVQDGLDDDGVAERWCSGLIVALDAADVAGLSFADIAGVAACSLATIDRLMYSADESMDEATRTYFKFQLVLHVLCEFLLRFGPHAYARYLRQAHPRAVRALLGAVRHRTNVLADAHENLRAWTRRHERYRRGF